MVIRGEDSVGFSRCPPPQVRSEVRGKNSAMSTFQPSSTLQGVRVPILCSGVAVYHSTRVVIPLQGVADGRGTGSVLPQFFFSRVPRSLRRNGPWIPTPLRMARMRAGVT